MADVKIRFAAASVALVMIVPAPAQATGPAPEPAQPPAEATAPPPEPLGPAEEPPDTHDPIAQALAVSPGGLTADTVAAKAVATAPTIAAKDAELRVAAAKVDQVMVSFFPTLQLGASYQRLSDVNVTFGSGALVGALNAGPLGVGPCPGGGGTQCVVDSGGAPVVATAFQIPQVLDQFSLSASLSIPISDYVLRTVRGLRAAKSSQRAAKAARRAEERKVRQDARVAYYNWLRAVAQVAVAEDALQTAKARLEDAQVGFRVGVMTKADLLRIEALVATAQRAQASARSFELLANRNLGVIMGEPHREYRVGEDVMGPVVEVADYPELDVLVEQARRDRPEVEVLQRNQTALRDGIRSQRAGYYPRFDVFGDLLYANPHPRFFPPTKEWNGTWAVGVRMTVNIGGIIQTRQQIKELQAQQRGLSAQEQALLRGVELEVTQAYADRKTALASLEPADKAREASEAAYRATVAQFRAGTATATDLIEAQGEQVSAQLQQINARIDLRVAEAKLAYASGRDNPA